MPELPANQLAEAAYNAYGDEREWKTFNGDPMPPWGAQAEGIRSAWRAAAIAVVDAYETAKPGPQQEKPPF